MGCDMLHESYLSSLSGLTARQRQELARYYASLDEERRVYVHWQQRTAFKHLLTDGRAPSGKGGEANYAALLIALKELWDEEQRGMGRMPSPLAEQPKRQRKPRKQQLRDSLEKRFMDALIQLREQEQLSWRQISVHFKKQFRKQVSHTYLKKIYDARSLASPPA